MKNRSSSGAGGAHIGMWGRTLMLRNEEGDKGGGGAAPPKPEDILETINKTMNAREKANEAKQAKKLNEAIAAAVQAALAAAGVKPRGEDEPPPDDDKAAKGGSPKVSAEIEAQLKKLTKELEDQKAATKASEERRLKAEEKALRDEERAHIMEMLSGSKGEGGPLVRSELMEDAAELLSRKVVRDPDTGAMLWKGESWVDKEGADNSDNYEKVDAGLKKWSESAKGKAYRPARDIGGGGTGRQSPGTGQRTRGGPDEVATDADIGSMILPGMTGQRR